MKKKLKSEASRRARNNRAKGHGFERDIAAVFRTAFPHIADQIKRTVQSSGGGAAEGSDFRFPNLWPECQLARITTPLDKLEQAKADCAAKRERKIPVAIVRQLGARSSFVFLESHWWYWLLVGAPLAPRPTVKPDLVIRVELMDFVAVCIAAELDKAVLP